MLHLVCVLCILLLRCCCLIKYQLVVVHRYHDGKINDLYMHPIVWCNAYISWYFCHYRYDFHHFPLAYLIESDDSCHFTLYPRYFHIYMKNIISLGYLSSFVESPFFWYLCSLVFIRKNSISLGHFLSYCPNSHYSALLPKIFSFPLTMPQYLVWRIFELSHSLYEDWSK